MVSMRIFIFPPPGTAGIGFKPLMSRTESATQAIHPEARIFLDFRHFSAPVRRKCNSFRACKNCTFGKPLF